MRPKHATFIVSAADASGFPPPTVAEIAFAGRSNVGKSSLINTLAGVSGLAKTSNTPGRTRLINWFRIVPQKGPELAFVDLPGYGYAKVAKSMREGWRPLIESYLAGRKVLRCVVVLIDTRRGPEVEEQELIEWLTAEAVPVMVVLTKADKLPKSKRKPVAMAAKRDLAIAQTPLLFSAESGEGVTELWSHLLRRVK